MRKNSKYHRYHTFVKFQGFERKNILPQRKKYESQRLHIASKRFWYSKGKDTEPTNID